MLRSRTCRGPGHDHLRAHRRAAVAACPGGLRRGRRWRRSRFGHRASRSGVVDRRRCAEGHRPGRGRSPGPEREGDRRRRRSRRQCPRCVSDDRRDAVQDHVANRRTGWPGRLPHLQPGTLRHIDGRHRRLPLLGGQRVHDAHRQPDHPGSLQSRRRTGSPADPCSAFSTASSPVRISSATRSTGPSGRSPRRSGLPPSRAGCRCTRTAPSSAASASWPMASTRSTSTLSTSTSTSTN